MDRTYDLIVIGAGPGGYVGAVRAAKLGLRTAVVERERAGGTCLLRGCVPAKAMIHASSLYRDIKDGEQFGIYAPDISYDYHRILSYKEDTIRQLCKGVEQLLDANGVAYIRGQGILEQGNRVRVVSDQGEEVLSGRQILLAAGSKPVIPPIPGLDLPGVLTSDELFKLEEAPESLLIIGGGVISVEFASVFSALGCPVTIVEAMPRLVPNMDKEISQNLKMILKKRGIDIHTSAKVTGVEKKDGRLVCRFSEKEKEFETGAQYILCAVGRAPDTDGLLGSNVELVMDGGRIAVDQHFMTSMKDVYAVGDLVKGVQLAHVASAQGMYVAEELAGAKPAADLSTVPCCVYTDPEIASAGMTEDEAKERGLQVKTGKFIMGGNAKSLISRQERGFIKVVADARTSEILGAHMMCARATDMIGEFVTAIANKLTVQQLLKSMRAHPTYNEAVGEALGDVNGEAVHVMPKKKRQPV